MISPLIAIVGDIPSGRVLDPVLQDAAKARKAAEELGAELAERGARLLVYGGPYLEADVVRGFVAAKPKQDHSIEMRYTKGNDPQPFPEEATHPKLFQRHSERGVDWEVAFYRAITRADGIILMGGGNATKISGQVAIGARMPILSLAEFGGGAAKVWETLSAGEDLPTREEIDLMARPWRAESAAACVKALFAQQERRLIAAGAPSSALSVLTLLLFLVALAIVPLEWGQNSFTVWMLFVVPLVAGGAGALIRLMIDRQRGTQSIAPGVLVAVVLGLVAGGIAGVLFVTAQLTADPNLTTVGTNLVSYARRSIPFALGVGFVAGLTSDAVFGKLLGLDTVRVTGIGTAAPRA
jgi:hypothetical protein